MCAYIICMYSRWRGSVGDKRDWVGVELEDIVPGGGTGYLQVRF